MWTSTGFLKAKRTCHVEVKPSKARYVSMSATPNRLVCRC